MGKASRWWKSLLGVKKDNQNPKNLDENQSRKDSVQPLSQIPVKIPIDDTGDSNWLRNYLWDSEKEQTKHAIAVAEATAAAADAAVVAAQAAVAVVRLTSHHSRFIVAGRESLAAVKIQAVFRGYLARKALRALKGLVKLQAHVRGYLVRKQTSSTLYSIRALIRAQAAAQSYRTRSLPSVTRPRRSMDRYEFQSKRALSSFYDHHPCYDDTPKIVEMDTYRPNSRSSRRSHYAPPLVSTYGNNDNDFLSYPSPARLSIPHKHRNYDYNYDLRISTTAHSTPRTPAKSVCDVAYCPSFMADTQSFRAKLRSRSAPRQRPESVSSPSNKGLSLKQVMASRRNSVSGVRMNRFCSNVEQPPPL